MKNKEIEELLNELKDKYSYEHYDTTGKVYTAISYEEGKLLLSYIEQLENNRDKAIEELEYYKSVSSIHEEKNIQNIIDKLKVMNKEEKIIADKTLLEFYDKVLEIVELLKPLNQKQLNYLKLQYDIVHKKVELNSLIKEGNIDV